MKNLIIAFAVFLVGCGCNQPYPAGNQYEYIQSPSGETSVIIYDAGLSYVVPLAFYNQYGYSYCVSYYHSHRGYWPAYNRSTYSSWRNTGRVVPSYRPSAPGYRPSGTVRPSASPSYRPSGGTVRPSAPSYRPSYTAPTRSTPSYRSSSSSSSRPSYSPSRSSRH